LFNPDPASWERQHQRIKTMTLEEYFMTEPRGAKAEMAQHLGISPTWLGQLLSGVRLASPKLSVAIEKATQGLVTRAELRPDLFL
jgi:DNA-binding transcriptional regulator YdaS (Cro superfamily)